MEIYDIYLATHLSFLVNGQRVDYTQFSQNQCLPSTLYMLSAQNPMDEPLSDNQNQQRIKLQMNKNTKPTKKLFRPKRSRCLT